MKTLQVVLLLLVALSGSATCLLSRNHVLVNTEVTWTEAQTYCRKNYVDLSTIDSAAELKNFEADTAMYYVSKSWVGLSKRTTERDFTRWSDGSFLGNIMWKPGKPPRPEIYHCVTIYGGMLSDNNCNEKYAFICYTWEPELMVVQEMKTWDEALKHCRTFYTDLISVDTTTDQLVVNNKSLNIKTSAVWTALHFLDGSWFWVNNQIRANIPSLSVCPIRPFNCGARRAGAEVWENRDCGERLNFICY